MNPPIAPLWRVFPWNPRAAEGEKFSAAFVPTAQGKGRFDIVASALGVLYLAEIPEHAIAENLQKYRNQGEPLEDADLILWNHRLARVPVTVNAAVWSDIVDLCDPSVLAKHQIHPDATAARTRTTSQGIANNLFDAGLTGLRWWSGFFGEWHTVVLFRDRLPPGALTFGTPVPLTLSDPHLIEATRLLDIG